MADLAQKKVDKEVKKVEQEIRAVYGQAQQEIEQKLKDFNDNFKIKKDIYYQKYKNHEITQTDYNSWRAGQLFQKQEWEAKRDQICKVLHNANEQATKIVNGGTISAFAIGSNWTAYSLEHGANVNFGFGVYDAQTVTNLLKNDPQILPQWKINEPKEYIWNKKKVNNAITQGIIQGESLDDIAKRVAKSTCNANKNLAMTHTQTAMTAAQNSGRLARLQEAKELGIKVVKEWMATLDGHTRDTHAKIDGEQKPVGDKWHHIKFSNGCEYPGDPKGPAHEVFNCRCTLVGDLEDFPEEYERYDNIDGKPIKNMTYEEWAKTKFKTTQTKANGKKANTIKKKIDIKAKEVADMKQKIENEGADYEFNNIWKSGTKTYADWEDVKDSIPSKIDYYEDQMNKIVARFLEETGLEKDEIDEQMIKDARDQLMPLLLRYRHGIPPGDLAPASWKTLNDWGVDDKADLQAYIGVFDMYGADKYSEYNLYVKQLQMFQRFGDEYSKLLAEYKAMQDELNALNAEYRKLTWTGPFGADAYTQERKDAALWAKTAKEADNVLRPSVGPVWQTATREERKAAYNYTAGSGKFNRPLRGYEDGWYNFKGIGNVPLNQEHAEADIKNLTELIKRTKLPTDTWLQRGVDTGGLAGFLQVSESDLRNATQEELQAMLIGKEISDAAFMSCGSSKGQGFSGNIMNIYCPKGTQAIYCEPFSAFGRGAGSGWDGKSTQSSFGGEDETLLQRNTYFRIVKVEKQYSKIYIDVEVIDQRPDEIKYN